MKSFTTRAVFLVIATLQIAPAASIAKQPSQPLPPLPERVTATIRVAPQITEQPVSPTFIGNNLHPGKPRDQTILDPSVQNRVREMGVKTIRFPNGCIADLYDWQSPDPYTISVEDFLDFCETVAAEPYYTLNMQGGTEGLIGKPPADAPLEDIVKHQHNAPNPCGYTNYHFGTLAEALQLFDRYTIQRARDGRLPIRHYELGNENWGQATTDWPPRVYGKTCEVYAAAFRNALAEAKKKYPGQLDDLNIYIVMVGYPTSGNNQDPTQAVNREINQAWTAEVNRLGRLGLIDAVQEHFYPYGNNNGSHLAWVVHNLHNILALRYGRPNSRLNGYRDESLAYNVPMESTEWNVKCWGPQIKTDLPLKNGAFEKNLNHWVIDASPANTAGIVASPMAARRGSTGALMNTHAKAEQVEIRQVFPVEKLKSARAFGATVWAKTDHPLSLHVLLRQANQGAHQGELLDHRVGTQTNMWERIIVGGKPFDDTTKLELVIRLTGPNTQARIDEVAALCWPAAKHSPAPLTANHFEQQLFLVDAMRELIRWPTPRTHLHHLFGNYPCTTMSDKGEPRDNAQAFYLLKDRIGDCVVRSECEVPEFAWHSYDAGSTDFNATVPSTTGIPALSALATRHNDQIHLLLVNRTTDRAIEARISLTDATPLAEGELRTLVGEDLDTVGAKVTTEPVIVHNPLNHVVPPHSAQVLTVRLSPSGKAP